MEIELKILKIESCKVSGNWGFKGSEKLILDFGQIAATL